MALLVGLLLAMAVGVMATASGLDRDRAFYPAVTMTIALYYVLFAVMGGSTRALVVESLIAVFSSCWRSSASGLHSGSSSWRSRPMAMDLWHGTIIANPGVPAWWRDCCLTYDLVAAGYLGWRLRSRRIRAA